MKEVTLKLHPASIGKRNLKYRGVPYNMSNQRVHWSVKKAWNDAWLTEIGYCYLEHKAEFGKIPLKDPGITILFYTCNPMDRDNAYHSAKPLIDALTARHNGLGIIKDDNDKELKSLVVRCIKVHHRTEVHTEIILKFS